MDPLSFSWRIPAAFNALSWSLIVIPEAALASFRFGGYFGLPWEALGPGALQKFTKKAFKMTQKWILKLKSNLASTKSIFATKNLILEAKKEV